MQLDVSIETLLEYTNWERRDWHDLLQHQGDEALEISAGPHGDGRFERGGEVIRHIFSAEKRYVERLLNRPLTDTASIPCDKVGKLFQFGEQSRSGLRKFIHGLPASQWDVAQDFTLLNSALTATPRKVVTHVVMHEIRHWAQIATLLRLHGVASRFHDFIFAPCSVVGWEPRGAKPDVPRAARHPTRACTRRPRSSYGRRVDHG